MAAAHRPRQQVPGITLVLPTNRSIVQCEQTIFQWTGGKQPYNLVFTPIGNDGLTHVLPLVQFTNIDATSYIGALPFLAPLNISVEIYQTVNGDISTTDLGLWPLLSSADTSCSVNAKTSGITAPPQKNGSLVTNPVLTPTDLTYCDPINITWTQGGPPYTLRFFDSGNLTNIPTGHPGDSSIFYDFKVNSSDISFELSRGQQSGWAFQLFQSDGAGRGTPLTINPGADRSCYLDNEALSDAQASSSLAAQSATSTSSQSTSSANQSQTTTSNPGSKKSNAGLIAGLTVGLIALALIALGAFILWRKRRSRTAVASPDENYTHPNWIVEPYRPQPMSQIAQPATGGGKASSSTQPPSSTTPSTSPVPPGSSSGGTSHQPHEIWHSDGGPAPVIEHPPAYPADS